MANAQLLVLVRSSAILTPEQIQGPVEAAARAAGFVPGPWTFNTQAVNVMPGTVTDLTGGGSGPGAIVQGGPWAGYSWITEGASPIPAQGVRLVFNAYRQNLLNGPANFPGGTASTITRALSGLPGVLHVLTASRSASSRITWDRGIPAPIELSATAPASSNGVLFGVAAAALLAFAASRGSQQKPQLAYVRRAATVASRTRLMRRRGR